MNPPWPGLTARSAILALGAAGCDNAEPVPGIPAARRPDERLNLRAHVTPGVASRISQTGQFIPAPPRAFADPLLTKERAELHAVTWARLGGPDVRTSLERQHGGRIDFAALRPCGRSYLADTPFEEVDPAMPNFIRNAYGPWWLVPLCGGDGRPRVSVGVAGYSTDVRVEDGRLIIPRVHGNEFVWRGVPTGAELPVSPERAAVAAAEAAGGRVAGVPELLLGMHEHPLAARWRVPLDRDAVVRPIEGGPPVRTRALLVVQHPNEQRARLYIADAAAPRAFRRTLDLPGNRRGEPRIPFVEEVRVRPGHSARSLRVTVEPAGDA